MAQLFCSECGFEFNENLASCPECGNPASECKPVNQGSSAPVAQQPTPASSLPAEQPSQYRYTPQVSSGSNGDKKDWAHYIYECGVIFWNSFSKKFAQFDGRATRREYWSFVCVSTFVEMTAGLFLWWLLFIGWFIAAIIPLIMIIPFFAVAIRRMHDINRSGWWILVPWASFFLCLKKSDPGVNDYGEPSNDMI